MDNRRGGRPLGSGDCTLLEGVATQIAVALQNARLVRGFLDVSDNRLKVAAINALRGMYDREPPLEKLPVFEAIDMAEAWKGRL